MSFIMGFQIVGFLILLTLLEGGRLARLVALISMPHLILYVSMEYLFVPDIDTLRGVILSQGLGVAIFGALALRFPVRWLQAMAVLQTIAFGLWIATAADNTLHWMPRELALYGLDFARVACLGWAGARGFLWPPTPAPAPGQPDPDLLAIARERWPQALAKAG